jgi:hypothetical protein
MSFDTANLHLNSFNSRDLYISSRVISKEFGGREAAELPQLKFGSDPISNSNIPPATISS